MPTARPKLPTESSAALESTAYQDNFAQRNPLLYSKSPQRLRLALGRRDEPQSATRHARTKPPPGPTMQARQQMAGPDGLPMRKPPRPVDGPSKTRQVESSMTVHCATTRDGFSGRFCRHHLWASIWSASTPSAWVNPLTPPAAIPPSRYLRTLLDQVFAGLLAHRIAEPLWHVASANCPILQSCAQTDCWEVRLSRPPRTNQVRCCSRWPPHRCPHRCRCHLPRPFHFHLS